ncbi:MAG: chemotaxis response regulator protein-glutamate methylesterase [Zoogloeaceae bacterium]|jgi:two-component system chemotaxis response regulator CheB|nr:chemotaxis response regulator protein-glutamate methylesterase [Zoogloeaceae bacterium]
MTEKIKVMIVDDSTLVRQVITRMLERDSDIKVIATAPDPVFAQEKMKAEWPDVLILDIEMPRMDGLSFLRQIMSERPTPTIICSHMATGKDSSVTQEALAIGALSVISKPRVGVRQFLEETGQAFRDAVRAAAQAAPALRLLPRAAHGKESAVARLATLSPVIPADRPKYTADVMLPLSRGALLSPTSERIIAIGTSTGGTQALEKVLTRLPADVLGIVIVQHMPENFTGMFTQRLGNQCEIEVREAQNGDRVRPGLALIAPGGRHMLVKRAGSQFSVEVRDGPHVSRHIPSVDVLFRSVACCAGANALGIIMTGMGDDGATGLKEMHDAGARTIAQDEASCVVFGMPKEAIKLGAADKVMPLARIPEAIVAYSRNG